jgi:hypothetical protein
VLGCSADIQYFVVSYSFGALCPYKDLGTLRHMAIMGLYRISGVRINSEGIWSIIFRSAIDYRERNKGKEVKAGEIRI